MFEPLAVGQILLMFGDKLKASKDKRIDLFPAKSYYGFGK
jgi:hypothetical protein